MTVLSIKNLTKYYDKELILKDINLEVPSGIIFALIGPNGAGKTTLIKSILSFTKVKQGEIKINDIESKNYLSHNMIAYFPEKFSFFPYFTVEGVLNFYGRMYGHHPHEISRLVDESLDTLEMGHLKKRKINKISKGELQRTGIASVLLSKARIFIFDEPFYGLDPIGIKKIKEIFIDLKEKGKTVCINSHILSEVEKMASQIAIINKGEILYSGDIETLTKEGTLEDSFYNMIKGGQT